MLASLKKPSLASQQNHSARTGTSGLGSTTLAKQREVFASKTRRTSPPVSLLPRVSILIEGGELDFARSVVPIFKNGGFNASDTDLMHGLIIPSNRIWILLESLFRVTRHLVPASRNLGKNDVFWKKTVK